MRTKKMAETLSQFLRKMYKSGLISLKNFAHPHYNRFKVIFLNNSLNFAFQSSIKPIFYSLKHFDLQLKTFTASLNSVLRPRFQQVISCLRFYINRRKVIVLLKILTKASTKEANSTHRSLFRAFSRLAGYVPRAQSPALSLSSESNQLSPQPKTSLPSRLPLSKTRHKFLSKEHTKSTMSLMSGERTNLQKSNSITKAPKNLTPCKFKPKKLINKTKKGSVMLKPGMYVETEGSASINSSFFEVSPRNQTFLTEDSPEKRPPWEEQILYLAVAMLGSLLKGHMKGYLKELVE